MVLSFFYKKNVVHIFSDSANSLFLTKNKSTNPLTVNLLYKNKLTRDLLRFSNQAQM